VRRQFVLALAAGVVGTQWDGWRERRLSRSLPTARADSPNVILIVLDTLRADHLSCYGYARATSPNIDALARRGARFERAISNCSWTLPAHASLFTGRYLHEHGADTRVPLSDVYPTLADVLAAQGYRTAGFAANTSFVTPEWGLRRGFAHFEAYGGSLADDAVRTVYGRKLAVNLLPRFGYWDIPGRKRAHQVNQEFLDWLDRSSPQPFFAFLNYLDVHDPYLPPSPFDTKFSRVPPRGDLINFQFQAHAYRRKLVLSAEEIQSEIDGYDGCLASLDDALGALFAELVRRGLDERTLVILTSDHGEAFGNHNLFGHGNSLYIETLHVPLIFVWPGRIPSGARIESVVGLQDVPPTVMELIGGTAASPFPGRSLGRLWRDDDDRRSGMVLSEVSKAFDGPPGYPNTTTDLKSLVTSEWHCIIPASGRAQLYAWTKDPTESDDLAGTPLGRDLVPEFDRTLKRLLRRPSGNA
jgi:arylsulfatase A-like enzyme